MPSRFAAVVLAAGRSRRLGSARSKVSHRLLGRPLVDWVVAAAREAGADPVLVVRAPGEPLPLADGEARQAVQETPDGTAGAALVGLEALGHEGRVLVLNGDTPLVSPGLLARLADAPGAGPALASMAVEDLGDYGEVRREGGDAVEVVEAAGTPRGPGEANGGVYRFTWPGDRERLAGVAADPASGERPITAVFSGAFEVVEGQEAELVGINTRAQFARAESAAAERVRARHLDAGVAFILPETTVVGPEVEIGRDATIGPGCTLLGRTTVGEGAEVGPGTDLVDAVVGPAARVRRSTVESSEIGPECEVGPYARLRGESRVGARCRVGNFVEVKASVLGDGVKVAHLAYLGDAEVGAGANIGAGAVTCNYDGVAKHRTVIGPGAFVGSDAILVAPIEIGEGSYVGAGSVVTKDVPAGSLAVARAQQRVVPDWARRRRP